MLNGVMLQYFEWELPTTADCGVRAARDAFALRRMGVYGPVAAPRLQGKRRD